MVARLVSVAKRPMATTPLTGAVVDAKAGRPPRYDTSWEATGPLIERYAIDLSWHPANEDGDSERWLAVAWIPIRKGVPVEVKKVEGPTPLIAVCELILKLAAAGKLTEPK